MIPNTYKIPQKQSIEFVVDYLVGESNKIQQKLREAINYDLSKWKDVIIKASIIQKESANVEEMPLVASVIDNRLAKNMKLQMDGTLNYDEFSHTKITAQRIKEDTSYFNTYLYTGLPPSAVCIVSIDAIMAALNPAKTECLYFVRDKKTKKHIFSATYNEHLENIKRQQSLVELKNQIKQ